MLFNSLEFIIFLPLVVAFFFILPFKWRWVFLLAASYFFYASWKLEYLLLIVASTLIDYFAAFKMSQLKGKKKRKPYLYLSIIVNLGILVGFKYLNFFNESIGALLGKFNIFYQFEELKVLLPVGISFYTFQTLSYTLDVYRGTGKVEKHLGIFALYVSFFPQLVAGPIERSTSLLPQFRKETKFTYDNLSIGFRLLLWGFFKKVVIADRIGMFVTPIYQNPENFDGITVLLATIVFLVQIYCDFSGYSDIAIGSARIMGYKLMKNFNRPFIARNITDFWARWHISLNTWFRDYVLFAMPMGKNKKRIKLRIQINMFITIVLVGLWHGASWTFVLWGVSIAIIMVLDIVFKKPINNALDKLQIHKLPALKKALDIVFLFFLLSLSCVLFRANSSSDIALVYSRLIVFPDSFREMVNYLFVNQFTLIFILIVFLFSVEFLHEKFDFNKILSKKSFVIRYSIYSLAIIVILFFGIFTEEEFIYFQF
jgi:alginate O-acetyltransferase complex protein AlgI